MEIHGWILQINIRIFWQVTTVENGGLVGEGISVGVILLLNLCYLLYGRIGNTQHKESLNIHREN